MNPSDALEAQRQTFLEALKVRRYSVATLASYADSLGVFFEYLAKAGLDDVREVSRQTMRDYQLWLQRQDYSPWTIATRLQALRRFFEYLENADMILINPCAGLTLPKLGDRLPKTILTPNEAKALLNAPDTQTRIGIRDKAILETFYSTGIRLAEITGLTIHDLDHHNGYVCINNGKFAKDRVVPLGSKACASVREYLEKVRTEWSPANRNERALWLSSKPPHGPLKSQIIEVLVKRYGRQAGLTKPVTPHIWRHTCASHLVAEGANIAYVQRLLGHRSLRTTQIYARTTISELKATYAKAHPQELTSDQHSQVLQPVLGQDDQSLCNRKIQP